MPSLLSLNDRWQTAIHLRGLGTALAAQHRYEAALFLLGKAQLLREETSMPIFGHELVALYELLLVEIRAKLGEQRFLALWAEGRAMPIEQILASLNTTRNISPLSSVAVKPVKISRHARYPDNLTRREVEVLCLLAQGLTNSQSAQRLMISSHTVNAHVRSIFNKISVKTRTAAIRYAFEHHLCAHMGEMSSREG